MKKKIFIVLYIFFIFLCLLLVLQMPYVIKYNFGNLAYEKKDYEKAISEYKSALTLFPPKYKECKIRINLSLAILKTIKFGETVDIELKILQEARNVLTENGCAHDKDSNGHSKEAERLKDDIDRRIKELRKQTDSDNEEEKEENNKEDKESKKDNQKDSNEKLEKLEKIQEKSLQERSSELQQANEFLSSEYYSGKNW